MTRRRLAAGLFGGGGEVTDLLGITGKGDHRKYMSNYLKAHGQIPEEVAGRLERLAVERLSPRLQHEMASVRAEKMRTGLRMIFAADPKELESPEFFEKVKDTGLMTILSDRGTGGNPTGQALNNFTRELGLATTALQSFRPGGATEGGTGVEDKINVPTTSE